VGCGEMAGGALDAHMLRQRQLLLLLLHERRLCLAPAPPTISLAGVSAGRVVGCRLPAWAAAVWAGWTAQAAAHAMKRRTPLRRGRRLNPLCFLHLVPGGGSPRIHASWATHVRFRARRTESWLGAGRGGVASSTAACRPAGLLTRSVLECSDVACPRPARACVHSSAMHRQGSSCIPLPCLSTAACPYLCNLPSVAWRPRRPIARPSSGTLGGSHPPGATPARAKTTPTLDPRKLLAAPLLPLPWSFVIARLRSSRPLHACRRGQRKHQATPASAWAVVRQSLARTSRGSQG
jgi:hypothetical protein